MTKLLQKAFKRASALPEEEQDQFARFLMAQIEDETEWDTSFASSQDELAKMADEASKARKARRTRPLDLSRDF